MKSRANLSLAVQMLAFSEGVLLAEKSGITREKAVEVLLASVIASPMVAIVDRSCSSSRARRGSTST